MINMKNLLYSIVFATLLQCVRCQISLTQPGAVTVKPLEVLQLPCKVTGASLTDSSKVYAVHWVRQPAGKGLEWLGGIWYSTDTNYAQSLQGRITVSRDTNKGEVYLKLTGMKPEETAVYYCTREAQWHIYYESMCKNIT
uniref:Ig-like domain-containing protein n=1 Tax=Xenopus tropicalis TaxID=8364 RepID=A0A803KDD8_XENTR